MNLTDPARSVTSSLDGGILAVLATAGRALTVGEIARLAPRGSEVGVRRSVERLVRQGTVVATQIGRNRVHELNRDHVAAPAAAQLAGLRLELWRRMRAAVADWDPAPFYAAVFGSAARGDGDEESDIDLLVIRPPGNEESWHGGLGEMLVPMKWGVMSQDGEQTWQAQIDALDERVRRWSGNPLHLVEIGAGRWLGRADEDRWLREALAGVTVVIAGDPALVPLTR